jgi:hypothetical protein
MEIKTNQMRKEKLFRVAIARKSTTITVFGRDSKAGRGIGKV